MAKQYSQGQLEALLDSLLQEARALRAKGDNRKAHGIDEAIAQLHKLITQ
jgi:hypothetical protein